MFTYKQSKPYVTQIAILAAILIVTFEVASVSASCGRCANGGKLLLPNNIFGHCRCLCSGRFAGPKCQFSVKSKRGEGSQGLWDLLERLEALEKGIQEKQQLEYLQHREEEMQGLAEKDDNTWLN